MTPISVFHFLVGLILLIAGAETLVRGASRLAAYAGVSSLIIGLTVVAFGTGSPELAVAVRATTVNQVDLAVGNVVGSNIFNILFILGVSALVRPVIVHDQLVRLDVPIMVLASGALFFGTMDGRLSHLEGVLFLLGILAYTGLLIRLGRRQRRQGIPIPADLVVEHGVGAWPRHFALVLAGLTLLVFGAHYLVLGAAELAAAFGVSELVIGLTIVAAGTSLPEVATTVVAGLRGERDIAVGNVVGSNIYNILAVLGTASVVAPAGLPVAPAAQRFDIPVMAIVAIVCLPIFFAHGRINRSLGSIFLGSWAAYTGYVILNAAQHDALETYNRVMTVILIPLAILMLWVGFSRAWRRGDRSG